MDMQKLFDLIDRASDNSNALRMPHHTEILKWIDESGISAEIYSSSNAGELIEQLRSGSPNTPNTWSGIRSLLETLLRRIVEVICERQGLDLIYRFRNSERTLHVGIVVRDTHTGSDAVYGIRDCDPMGPDEPIWEYLPVNCPRLFDAISWRMRDLRRSSIYGWVEPANINKPLELH